MKTYTCPEGSNLIELIINNTVYHLCSANVVEYRELTEEEVKEENMYIILNGFIILIQLPLLLSLLFTWY